MRDSYVSNVVSNFERFVKFGEWVFANRVMQCAYRIAARVHIGVE